MTKTKHRFRPGQLVWVSKRVVGWHVIASQQTAKGYPVSIKLEPGKPCTVIRRALAKDYGRLARCSENDGKSIGRRAAEGSWLVLYEGVPTMIDDQWLSKRYYKPRKPNG